MRLPLASVTALLALTLAAPAALAAEARLLTAADIAGMGGTDFKGGIGDYLLRNDKVEAVILAVDATPDFGIPIVTEALPGRGVLIDLGTRSGGASDKNDQLGEIDHVVNLGQNPIFYDTGVGAPVFVSGGATASITVFGIVLNLPVPSPLVAVTTYTLSDGDSHISVETAVTNTNTFPVPAFSIADVDITVSRGRLPFQPFPNRGHKPPPLDLTDPTSLFTAIGVMNYVSTPGNNGPTDGPANNDGSPSGEVSYTLVADSLFTPLFALASGVVTVASNPFDLAAVAAGTPPTIAPGGTLTFKRKIVVGKGNSVEASLDAALPLLGLGATRATFTGRIVDGAGTPVPNAHIFFDNIAPGADPLLVTGLITFLDENQDGAADGVIPAAGGAPLPTTHVLTAADGTFSVKLPVLPSGGAPVIPSVYTARVQAPERGTVTFAVPPVDFSTIGVATALGDVALSDTGTLSFTVNDLLSGLATPAKLTVVGVDGTNNPDFGSQYLSLRNFSGLSKNSGADGKDPVREGNSAQLSEVLVGSPALNFHVDADGSGTVDLAPGNYRVYASRGLEYTLDSAPISISAGATTHVTLGIEPVVDTSGYVSADFHIHSARSFDSSVPFSDRATSFLAAGVDVMVSTEHDAIADFAPIIASLGASDEITSIIGNELTGGNPVPADPTQDGTAFPQGIGHWNAWPLSLIPGNRRHGAPQDEFITPGTAIDRLRGMDSLPLIGKRPDDATIVDWLTAIAIGEATGDDEVVMLNHPRAGFAGVVIIGLFNGLANPSGSPSGGYDPTLPITSPPNDLLFTPSLYNAAVVGPGGTSTTALSFDAMEVMNGTGVGAFLRVKDDWCSLLDQDIRKTGTGVSDSHRLILESPGFARSFVASSTDDPAAVDENELTDAVKAMQVTGTTGPFVRFSVEDDGGADVGLGGTALATGEKVVLKIRVEAAPWIPVEEVRIYRNCELLETHAVKDSKVLGKVLRFNQALPLDGIDADSYFHVEAGVRIDASGDPISPELLETVQIVEPGVEPFAFTNPIFVDRDGGGYVPPGL